MNLTDLFTIAPKLLPLIPKISQALATVDKLINDPDIKEAIETLEQVAAILNQKETT